MARKRGNGEGSITHRTDGRWCARYTVHSAYGSKRRYIYGKTRQEVAEKLAKALYDRASGLVFDAGSLTIGEYLDRWLSHSVRGYVRQRTFERYEQIARVHIKPTLGRIKLKALTPAHVRGLYREKLDAGLAPRTVQYIHVTLQKALSQAVADGLISRSATASVKAPRPTKKEIRPPPPTRPALSSRQRMATVSRPCTLSPSTAGYARANCWASSGRTWTSKPECYR